jgi:hypothetical protein
MFITSTGGATQQCEIATKRHDPCVTVGLRSHRLTVAWDKQTKVATYLFTDDQRLVGDSELAVGGSCRIGGDHGRGDSRLSRHGHWLVSANSKERFHEWSGNATWYAALQIDSDNPSYATIVGFVQSRDLEPSHGPPK